MNFSHSKVLLQGENKLNSIHGICWSANNMRIAAATNDNKILLFDENGNKKESFSTKPRMQGKPYKIRSICFSPDSVLLAIAQSDNIIFVYKLGEHWGDKKTICNKLEQSASVTCMVWSKKKVSELFFGCEDGKIKSGYLKKNQSKSLYSNDGIPATSIAVSLDGKFVISGHADNTIYKYNLENFSVQKLCVHSTVPYCIGWGAGGSIIAAGNDYRVTFYNDIGKKTQNLDYSQDEKLKEFSAIQVSPSGEAIALGNFNKFYVFLYNGRKQIWEACIKAIDNYYSVTAICWKPDGSGLITGNLVGNIDLFETCLYKTTFRDIFEITYVSHSQVLIKNTNTSKRLIIKPKYSTEITKMNIYLDNFVVMFTKESMIVGDITLEKYSEIQWRRGGQEKFDFSNTNVCMIYSIEGLALIEYGSNEILGYCPTEYVHSNLISCRLNYSHSTLSKNASLKIIAYLADLNTICVQDLVGQQNLVTINHDSKIDYLELNKSGNKLIFRDRKRHLFLYHIFDKKKVTLLNFCGFVQWVPNSEVLVAQERKNVCVWYNVDDPDKVKIIPVKGDVEEIRRKEGKTEVVVEEVSNSYGNSQIYLLDDGLIAFSTSVDENNLNKAVKILENLEMTAETETHWKTLANLAIQQKNLTVAERCFASIGSYSKANYIKKIIKFVETKNLPLDNPLIEAKLLILDKQFNNAENLLLNHQMLDESLDILNELQKWDESVKLAEKYKHPEINKIKSQYFDWLMNNQEFDKAAELKEHDGEYQNAIELYLKGGYPAKAANLVMTYYSQNKFSNDLIENIISSLNQVGIYEKAGELLEVIGHAQRSLNSYRQACCYSKAVEVAKKHYPTQVEKLEEEWGTYLFNQKSFENAIIHFLEAGAKDKAIDSAINARKWDKAIELLNECQVTNPAFYMQIGRHFEFKRKLDEAEKYYIKSGDPLLAFMMYVNSGKWDKVEEVVKTYLKGDESAKIIANYAVKLQQEGRLKEAEKLYIMGNDVNSAIQMYKVYKQYDNMIRLVSQYQKEHLKMTHDLIGSLLERENKFKQAEYHYIQAGAWNKVCSMYKEANMWEDCLRVAKSYGSRNEINELAKGWVKKLPKDEQIEKLISMGLSEAAIDIYCSNNEFETAFKLAEAKEKYKIPDIHLKYAEYLERQKNYQDAEDHYIKASAIQNAIQMYEHIFDFPNALRIARQHDQNSVDSIYINNAKFYLEKGDFLKAEKCFINGKKPEYMIKVYLNEKNYDAAINLASKYCPQIAADLRNKKMMEQTSEDMSGDTLLDNARMLEKNGDYKRAIDTYLDVSEKHFEDKAKLEEIWNRAVSLAMECDKERQADIVNIVGQKMMKIQKYLEAGNLFYSIGNCEDAIVCFCKANNYKRAKDLVNSMKSSDTREKLMAKIQREEKEFLVKNKDASGLVNMKQEEGVQILFDKKDYDNCLKAAKEISPEVFNKYIILIVKDYLNEKNLSGTADFLEKNGTPIYQYNLQLYEQIAMEILADENLEELGSLNKMLKCVNVQLEKLPEFKNQYKVLLRLNKVAYYQYLKFMMKQKKEGFPKSYYRICQTVLAFGDIIKFDLALYDAGIACKESGYVQNAFIILQRYIDFYYYIAKITALEEESALKNTEFNFLTEAFTSNENIISEEEKEHLVKWAIDVGNKFENKSSNINLIKRTCPKCKKENYEANTYCHYCGFNFEICVITGFPIYPDVEAVSCSNCGRKGIKECWKEWIGLYKTCPNCLSVQMSYK